MKCSKCGRENANDVLFCGQCGSKLESNNTQAQASSSDDTLRLIAFIFNLLFTILFGFILIPLAWMVPMTVISYKIYKGTKPNTVAFGVCTLIFVNLISGILLLCSTKDA